MNSWRLQSLPLGRGSEWLLARLQTPWRSLNGCTLADAHLWVPDCPESDPQSLHLAWRAERSRISPVRDPTTSTELRCNMASSTQTHLTGIWPRELLFFRSGALRSWDPMVVETWIEMLRERLKHISSLLRLGTSVDALLEAWTSSMHPLLE
jgi:hypothetical protein